MGFVLRYIALVCVTCLAVKMMKEKSGKHNVLLAICYFLAIVCIFLL